MLSFFEPRKRHRWDDAVVVDVKVNKVGTILDVFGPVKQPYIAIRPFQKKNLEKFIGQMLYLYKR